MKKATITFICCEEDHIVNRVDLAGELLRRIEWTEDSTTKIIYGDGDQFVIITCEDGDWLFKGTEEELISLCKLLEEEG